MEWFALIVPIITCLVALKYFRQYFAWWEYLIPPAGTVMIILLCKLCIKTSLVNDTEYWGSLIVKARYYEYWESWVTKTCSETYECNCTTDNKGHRTCQTCTRYYDCSYCDENSAYWVAYDDAGNSWRISKEYYNYLQQKWRATPQFVDMHRDIDDSHGCGKDGDAYDIVWNGTIETSEASVTTHSYTNRVQASHSSFKLPNVSKKEAKTYQLYDYPSIYNHYKQKVVLGLDSVYGKQEVERIETLYQYFNGYYGKRNKIKLFVCLFYNKPQSVSYKQEAYWDGGNQNELVVCIGMDKQKTLQWVRVFSWTNEKRIGIDIREDVMNMSIFKPDSVYTVIQKAVGVSDVHRSFKKDFSYLRIDLPNWALWVIWIFALLVSGGTFYWCYSNEFEDNTKPRF